MLGKLLKVSLFGVVAWAVYKYLFDFERGSKTTYPQDDSSVFDKVFDKKIKVGQHQTVTEEDMQTKNFVEDLMKSRESDSHFGLVHHPQNLKCYLCNFLDVADLVLNDESHTHDYKVKDEVLFHIIRPLSAGDLNPPSFPV